MPTQETIRLLFLAANPQDTTRLQIDEEMRAVDQSLRMSDYRDRFDLRSHGAVRYGELQELLMRYQPHIVHFSGHGSPFGEIILQSDSGVHPVSAEALSRLFGLLKDNVRCVVLNACYSAVQANAIAEHIDCVIGMSNAMSDMASINFSVAFYRALGYGRSIKAAFELGCNEISLAKLPDKDIPQLLAAKRDPSDIVLVQRVTPAPVNSRTAIINLRNILAELYPDETSTRRVVTDAGLDARRIAFSTHALNNWHAILTEAAKVNHSEALLDIVLLDYGENQQLRAAYDAYSTYRSQG